MPELEVKSVHSIMDNVRDHHRTSLVAHLRKNLPAMQETQVQSLLGEDPLEKEVATHCIMLVGKSHTEGSLVGCSPWSCKSQTRLND